jgi:hypothetical protein
MDDGEIDTLPLKVSVKVVFATSPLLSPVAVRSYRGS